LYDVKLRARRQTTFVATRESPFRLRVPGELNPIRCAALPVLCPA
jgi:hypothetical protein